MERDLLQGEAGAVDAVCLCSALDAQANPNPNL